MKPILFVMCGVSGSGKSTWAQKYKNVHPDTVIVSTDEIREELFGDCRIQKDGDKVFQIAYERLSIYLTANKDVIFDAMSLKPKDRLTLLMLFDSIAHMACVVTGNDCASAIENQYKRDRHVPEEVVRAQCKRFIAPDLAEGWECIIDARTGESKGVLIYE